MVHEINRLMLGPLCIPTYGVFRMMTMVVAEYTYLVHAIPGGGATCGEVTKVGGGRGTAGGTCSAANSCPQVSLSCLGWKVFFLSQQYKRCHYGVK